MAQRVGQKAQHSLNLSPPLNVMADLWDPYNIPPLLSVLSDPEANMPSVLELHKEHLLLGGSKGSSHL